MEFKTKYEVDQMVYLRHDPDQHKRMIVDYCITRSGIQYVLRCGSEESEHFENELRRTRDNSMAMNLKDAEE